MRQAFSLLSFRIAPWVLSGLLSGCAITATRPIQPMSNTTAAMKAAKEVQADVLAPELFRQALEWYERAKKEYRFKYYARALDYSNRARRLAEEAELEALINGAKRSSLEASDDPLARPPSTEEDDVPALEAPEDEV